MKILPLFYSIMFFTTNITRLLAIDEATFEINITQVDKPHFKSNQDRQTVMQLGKNLYSLMIFDGHGPFGAVCAQKSLDEMTAYLKKQESHLSSLGEENLSPFLFSLFNHTRDTLNQHSFSENSKSL